MAGDTSGRSEMRIFSAEEIIAAIRAMPAVPASRNRSRKCETTRRTVRKRQDHSAPCHCGECPGCLEEARWERIFTEKFVSTDYYGERHLQNWSTLARR